MESLASKEVPGTEATSSPFGSPDSRFVGFFAENKLKKVELATSTVQIVCEAPIKRFSYGGAWSPAGVIWFVPDELGGILKVSANGGYLHSSPCPTRHDRRLVISGLTSCRIVAFSLFCPK